MTTRQKILLVTPGVPHPLNSGVNIRVSNIARALAEVGEIHLLSLANGADLAGFADAQNSGDGWWQLYESVQLHRHPAWRAFEPQIYTRRLAFRRFATTPLMYESYPVGPLRAAMQAKVDSFDLIWVERLFVAHGLGDFATRMIVDVDDLESVKLARQIESGAMNDHAALRREVKRLAHFEQAAASKYRRVATCSRQDADTISRGRDNAFVLPNGVDDDFFRGEATATQAPRLVFVGTLNYPPNADAVLYFCQQILPALRDRIPDVAVDIVGRSPPDAVKNLADGKHVFVHADVPDVACFVQAAALSIVPLRVGGGTRLKILESLALGTPVVSTTIGAEGLDLQHQEHLLLADTPSEFVAAIVAVLDDAGLRRRLASQGRDRVSKLYRWCEIRRGLSAVVAAELEALGSKRN